MRGSSAMRPAGVQHSAARGSGRAARVPATPSPCAGVRSVPAAPSRSAPLQAGAQRQRSVARAGPPGSEFDVDNAPPPEQLGVDLGPREDDVGGAARLLLCTPTSSTRRSAAWARAPHALQLLGMRSRPRLPCNRTCRARRPPCAMRCLARAPWLRRCPTAWPTPSPTPRWPPPRRSRGATRAARCALARDASCGDPSLDPASGTGRSAPRRARRGRDTAAPPRPRAAFQTGDRWRSCCPSSGTPSAAPSSQTRGTRNASGA